jgi:hypothetical protein
VKAASEALLQGAKRRIGGSPRFPELRHDGALIKHEATPVEEQREEDRRSRRDQPARDVGSPGTST